MLTVGMRYRLIRHFLYFGLVLACYLPALRGGFLIDDVQYLLDNPAIHNTSSPWHFWWQPEYSDSWPVFYTALWLLWRVFGAHAWGYHLVNCGVHTLNTLLFGRALQRYPAIGKNGTRLAMLLFALHPVNVEAVAWIFQLKTLLAVTLTFAAWEAYHRDGVIRYLSALLLFTLALLTKTSILLFPAVILIHHFWTRDLTPARAFLRATPFFLISAGIVSWSMKVNEHIFAGKILWTAPLEERLLTAASNFWFYLLKLVLPIGLQFIYPWRSVDPAQSTAFLPALALGVAAIYLLYQGVDWKWNWARATFAAFAFYFVNLIPAFSIPYLRYFTVADHYQYFAMLGPLALAGAGAEQIWGSKTFRRAAWSVPALYFALSFNLSRSYRDMLTLWRDAIEANPGSVYVSYNFGVAALDAGYLADARKAFELTLSTDSGRVEYLAAAQRRDARFALAKVFVMQNQFEPARAQLEALVLEMADYPHAYDNLARVYRKLGFLEKAQEAERRAAAIAGKP